MKITRRQLKQLIESNLKGGSGDDMKSILTKFDDDEREKEITPLDIEVIDDFNDESPMNKRVNRRTFLKGLLGLTATFLAGGILKLTGGSGRQYQGRQVDMNDGSMPAKYCQELLEAIKKYQPQWLEPGNPIRYFMDAGEMEGTGGGFVYPYAFDANTQTFYHVTDGDLEVFLFDAYGPENLSKLLDYQIQRLKQDIEYEKDVIRNHPEFAQSSQEAIAFFEEQIREMQSPGYLPVLDHYGITTLSIELNVPMPEGLYYFDSVYGLQRLKAGGESIYYAPGRDHGYNDNGGVEIDQDGRKVFIKVDRPNNSY